MAGARCRVEVERGLEPTVDLVRRTADLDPVIARVRASAPASGESLAWTRLMLWLVYMAWWVDLVGLVPGAAPEARLLPVRGRAPGGEPPSPASPAVGAGSRRKGAGSGHGGAR